MTHGSPRPTKMFTELEPVTLPMAESANSEFKAAVLLANVSGREVPMATNVIAVTDSFKNMLHPRIVAASATTAVMVPIKQIATKKAAQPPYIFTGGIHEKRTFHPMVAKCMNDSNPVTSATIKSSSSICGQSFTALRNWPPQVGFYYSTKYCINLVCSSMSLFIFVAGAILTIQTFFFDILTDSGSAFSILILNINSCASSSLSYGFLSRAASSSSSLASTRFFPSICGTFSFTR